MIVTGAVALGTPLINGLLAARQSKHTARSGRLDELRSVLDDAALPSCSSWTRCRGQGTLRVVPQRRSRHGLALVKSALMRVWEQEARIGVRLGVESEVFKAYGSAHKSARNYLVYYGDWLRSPQQQGGKLQDIDNQRAAAYGKFFDLAAALTGPTRE